LKPRISSRWGFLIPLLLVAFACQIPTLGPSKPGQVTIAIGMPARTVVADWNKAVDSYTVTLSGNGKLGSHTTTVNAPVSTANFADVESGTWTVSVIATKLVGSTPVQVGAGSGSVGVSQANASSATISLSTTQKGAGGFSFTFAVPTSTGITSAEAQLYTNADGTQGPAMSPSLAADGTNQNQVGTVALSGVPSGSYRLELRFLRGANLAGVFSEAVNIWDNVTSDQWLAPNGTMQSQRDFDATEFNSADAALSNLAVRDSSGAPLSLGSAFASNITAYSIASQTISGSSVELTATGSVDGQGFRYRWNTGAWAALTSRQSSSTLSVVGGGTLEVQVTASDSTPRTYTISISPPFGVTYDGNGSDGGSIPIDTVGHQAGATALVLDNVQTLTKSGYTFYGWNTASDGSGKTVLPGETVVVTGPTKLYALWVSSAFTITNGVITGYVGTPTGTLTIPNGVVEIGADAFSAPKGLGITDLVLPDSLKVIGVHAFQGCTGMNNDIFIPDSVTTIATGAFQDCSGISGVYFNTGSQLTSLGDSALQGCSSIGTLDLSTTKLTSLGNYTFLGSQNLTSVILPATLTSLGSSNFYTCPRLTSFALASGNATFQANSGVLYSLDGTSLMAVPPAVSGTLVVPNSVTVIGQEALMSCAISGVNLPANLLGIGDRAFYGCPNLSAITIPASVTSLGYSVFYGSSSLTSVTMQGASPPNLPSGSFTFFAVSGSLQIHVPNSTAQTLYQAASGWSDYSPFIVTP